MLKSRDWDVAVLGIGENGRDSVSRNCNP